MSPRSGGAALPVATFVLVLGSALVGRYLLAPPGGGPPSPVPEPMTGDLRPVVDLDALGWAGPEELSAAGLELRLATLQADPARQAFDAQALAERLGLGPGQAWQLELAWSPREPGAAGEPGRAGAEGLLAALEAWSSGGWQLTVLGADGVELRPLVEAVDPGVVEAGTQRHLLALFDPRETLVPHAEGFQGRVVLWGPQPSSSPSLALPGGRIDLHRTGVTSVHEPIFVAAQEATRVGAGGDR